MKVLWLVSITIPAAADACGLQAKEIGGGWLSGALGATTLVGVLAALAMFAAVATVLVFARTR